jgi:hypothetical protein
MSEDDDMPDVGGLTPYGFTWGPIEVQRITTFNGRRILGLYIDSDKPRRARLQIYVSPTGRSVRVWRDGKELK